MAAGEDWWREFFSGPWLTVQRTIWSPEQTRAHVDRIEALLSRSHEDAAHRGRVLDAPCGEGRIALELARRGWSVTGIDLCEPLLADARAAAAREGLSIDWRLGDMRDVDDRGALDAAVCWWGSFGYFDDEGDARFARAIARALRPGGRWVIDTHLAESLLPRFQRRGCGRDGDIWVVEERSFDLPSSRVEVDWTFLRSGEQAVTRHTSIRLYTFREIEALLRGAGFARVDAYDESGAPFAVGASRVGIVATKAPF